MTESGGPVGGHGDKADFLPRKVGGALGPRFRTMWHRGDKARAERRSAVLDLQIMRVFSPDATAWRRLPVVLPEPGGSTREPIDNGFIPHRGTPLRRSRMMRQAMRGL